PLAVEPVRRLGPVAQRIGMNPEVLVVADHGPGFAKVEPIAPIAYGRLALAYLASVRGREQPLRKRALAHPGSRRAQQLEEAPVAEQIEICGVDVVRIFEGHAGRALAVPPVLEPRDAPPVERGSPPRGRPSIAHASMVDDESDEQRGRRE